MQCNATVAITTAIKVPNLELTGNWFTKALI